MNLKLALKFMTNSATKKEKATFEKWLRKAESNKRKYEDFVSGWDKSAEELKSYHPDAEKAWNRFASKIQVTEARNPVTQKTIFISHWRSIAAAVAILIITSIILFTQIDIIGKQTDYIVYTTNDSIKSIVLADGSSILLNKQTELRVPQWQKKDNRLVYLKGEAFFEVTHNPKRPFLVQTNYTTTRVLGTSFNLSTFGQKDIVNLVTGKIEIYANDAENDAKVLAPGEMLSYNHHSQSIEQSQYTDRNFLAWKTGELEFKDTPLPEVLDVISNFYQLSYSGNIRDYENYTLTATFRKQPIDKLIKVLELTWNARIAVASDTLYLNFNTINQ